MKKLTQKIKNYLPATIIATTIGTNIYAQQNNYEMTHQNNLEYKIETKANNLSPQTYRSPYMESNNDLDLPMAILIGIMALYWPATTLMAYEKNERREKKKTPKNKL